jgi:hypothetical protein
MRADRPDPGEFDAPRPTTAHDAGPGRRDDPRDGSDHEPRAQAGHDGLGDRPDRGAAARPASLRAEGLPGREEMIAERLRYARIVDATYQAAADRQAWTEAVPGLRAAWDNHKNQYPEQCRAAPRTQPDGTWVAGDHRRLSPEQNAEAGKAHADLADEADRDILPALQRIEAADPRRHLAGLDHMVKGEDRLKEKLADAWHARPGLAARQVLGLIPDAVRSTLSYSAEHYAEGVPADVERLKAEGFELIKLKNLWHADQYKGVNSQWVRPETGTRFEMQFHTPESLEAKELTHEAYERLRANAVLPVDKQDPAEARDLENFQRRVNTLIATPPETGRIKDFPENNDG